MNNKILLVALEAELPREQAPDEYTVVYTGVGKVNAAIAATQAIIGVINQGLFPEVINYGTAGSCRDDLSGMHRIEIFVQRDIDARPTALRGVTPFEDTPLYFHTKTGVPSLVLGTGDQFVHEFEPWLKDNGIDLVDMEAYAIAKVCKHLGVQFRCYKYITDYVGTPHQSETWQKNVANGVEEILNIL